MNTIFETMKLRDHFEESARLAQDILQDASFFEAMESGADLLIGCLKAGHKIMSCGNGGRCAMPCISLKN